MSLVDQALDKLQSKLERYERALKIYADEENWMFDTIDDQRKIHWVGPEGADGHGYEIAEEALAGEKLFPCDDGCGMYPPPHKKI